MRCTPFLLTAFILSASGLPEAGPLFPGIGVTPEARQISANAGRNPNSTSSIEFNRSYNNTEEGWSWRINITEVVVPDNINELGEDDATFNDNHRIVNTQWQLGWPGDGDNFQSYLQSRNNMTASFKSLIIIMPSNVTNRFNVDDKGDCKPVLGETCAESLTSAVSGSSSLDIRRLEGCESTLNAGISSPDHYGDMVGFDIDPQSNSSDSDQPLFHRNDTLVYQATNPYTAGNDTIFDASQSALQLLVMTFSNRQDGSGEAPESSGASVLCQVVDKQTAQEPEEPGPEEEEPPNAAPASWSHSALTLWGLAGLSALLLTF